jgi:hypothetical protein
VILQDLYIEQRACFAEGGKPWQMAMVDKPLSVQHRTQPFYSSSYGRSQHLFKVSTAGGAASKQARKASQKEWRRMAGGIRHTKRHVVWQGSEAPFSVSGAVSLQPMILCLCLGVVSLHEYLCAGERD